MIKMKLKTITLTIHDGEGGTTTKITRQISVDDDAAEVIAVLREMLLGCGYQPETLDRYIHNI